MTEPIRLDEIEFANLQFALVGSRAYETNEPSSDYDFIVAEIENFSNSDSVPELTDIMRALAPELKLLNSNNPDLPIMLAWHIETFGYVTWNYRNDSLQSEIVKEVVAPITFMDMSSMDDPRYNDGSVIEFAYDGGDFNIIPVTIPEFDMRVMITQYIRDHSHDFSSMLELKYWHQLLLTAAKIYYQMGTSAQESVVAALATVNYTKE